MPRFAANLSMLYGEHDFLDRFAAAAKDGFRGVEYLFPYAYEKEVLAEAIREVGLLDEGDLHLHDDFASDLLDPKRTATFVVSFI